MIEDVLNKLRNIIQLGIQTELQAQTEHAGDQVQLDNPASVLVGSEQHKGLPMIRIMPNGYSQELFMTSKKNVFYNVSFQVLVTDTDAERSERRLWRTLRALECCLEKNAPNNSPILNYETESVDYNADIQGVEGERSTEKGAIMTAKVTERLDSYVNTQV